MTHYPEIGAKNRYQKTCTGFLQVCHAIRYRFFLVRTEIWYGLEHCCIPWRKPVQVFWYRFWYRFLDSVSWVLYDAECDLLAKFRSGCVATYYALLRGQSSEGQRQWTCHAPTAKRWLSVVRCVRQQSVYFVKCFITNNNKSSQRNDNTVAKHTQNIRILKALLQSKFRTHEEPSNV